MTAERPTSRRRRLRVTIGAILGAVAWRVLGRTWTVRFDNPSVLADAKRNGRPVVIVLWHGELLPLTWAHRHRGISTLISTHSDGEIIARVTRTLGYRTLRGSTSRGGARALLQCVQELRAGRDVAITTDGPRGPRRVSAPGAALAAVRTGAAVVAMGAIVDRAWRLRSWDRFIVPKPFARVRVRYAMALEAGNAEFGDGATRVPDLQRALMAVCAPDPA